MALPIWLATALPGLIKKGTDMLDKKFQTEAEKESAVREFEAETRRLLEDAAAKQEQERTERHKNDMSSDSWLSKNIRPLVLIYLMGAWSIFAGISAYGLEAAPEYVVMLKDMLMAAFGFYFVSRGVEKVVEIVKRKN